MIKHPDFINSLIKEGVLTSEESGILVEEMGGNQFAVLTHLVRDGATEKNLLGKLWGDSIGVAYVNLDETLFQKETVELLPEKFARDNLMIPLYSIGKVITVATSDPKGKAVKEAETVMGRPVSTVFSIPDEIEDAIEIQYKSRDSIEELVAKLGRSALMKTPKEITKEQLVKLSGDKAVVELVRGLLLLGVKEDASDIHIEPQKDIVKLRFRIDGVIQDRKIKLAKDLLAPLVSRLKIMADLDITIKRRPQDGHITLNLQKKSIDFRFSSIPTIYGEKVVLRILTKITNRDVPSIYQLALSQGNIRQLTEIIKLPYGIFLVTGPTGSGKTTSLFSVLKHLNQGHVNIVTIEDPVEYRLDGINQVQVDRGAKLDFALALRAYLRQDPDVILVGEIRDQETAKIAVEAALTGHLILASMHTNSAIQSVTRLAEIGVEPFMVAPSLIGVWSQRLVRRICGVCKEKYLLTREEASRFFTWKGRKKIHFYRGKGCPQCGESGYQGRLAVQEVLAMNKEIQSLIEKEASVLEIEKAARSADFRTMHYDGLKKVLRGLTTIDEIERIVPPG